MVLKLPAKGELTVQFAHAAYRMDEVFETQNTGIKSFQTWSVAESLARVGEADVLVISGFWRNEMLDKAKKLKYVQSISAGYDQYPLDRFRERGVVLCNASGANRDAVAQHATALMLALCRKLPQAADNQRKHHWRGMISKIADREDDLCGQTLLIVGLGAIGSQLSRIAKVLGMTVIGVKRNPSSHDSAADEVHPTSKLPELLGRADYVALCCPLTDETRGIIDDAAFKAMKPSAYLINVARGRCVDELALLKAMTGNRIAGAAIDHFWDEPLEATSPFWDLPNVLITPHTGGETQKYEANVIGFLMENLTRTWSGRDELVNRIV